MARIPTFPQIAGFTIEQSNAVWITCNRCEEQELICGVDLHDGVFQWAADHIETRHCIKVETDD